MPLIQSIRNWIDVIATQSLLITLQNFAYLLCYILWILRNDVSRLVFEKFFFIQLIRCTLLTRYFSMLVLYYVVVRFTKYTSLILPFIPLIRYIENNYSQHHRLHLAMYVHSLLRYLFHCRHFSKVINEGLYWYVTQLVDNLSKLLLGQLWYEIFCVEISPQFF